jgi:hypothetical protein
MRTPFRNWLENQTWLGPALLGVFALAILIGGAEFVAGYFSDSQRWAGDLASCDFLSDPRNVAPNAEMWRGGAYRKCVFVASAHAVRNGAIVLLAGGLVVLFLAVRSSNRTSDHEV